MLVSFAIQMLVHIFFRQYEYKFNIKFTYIFKFD